MGIEITIRHQDTGKGLKQYAEKRVQKIVEKFPRLENIRVVIDSQRHLYKVEIAAQMKGQTAIGSEMQAENVRSAVDMAAARAENQLRKNRKRIVTLHTRP